MTASSVSERLSPLQRDFLRAFATRPCGFFLSGGAVLVGWVLAHRSTDDLDLFTIEDAPMGSDRALPRHLFCRRPSLDGDRTEGR